MRATLPKKVNKDEDLTYLSKKHWDFWSDHRNERNNQMKADNNI
jgi:hypothetical protein